MKTPWLAVVGRQIVLPVNVLFLEGKIGEHVYEHFIHLAQRKFKQLDVWLWLTLLAFFCHKFFDFLA